MGALPSRELGRQGRVVHRPLVCLAAPVRPPRNLASGTPSSDSALPPTAAAPDSQKFASGLNPKERRWRKVMRKGQLLSFPFASPTCSCDPRSGAAASSLLAGPTLPLPLLPQNQQRPRQDAKAAWTGCSPRQPCLHPRPNSWPLTSRDRTLLGSSSSRVKTSPRFTVSWDPSSNSTCQGDAVQLVCPPSPAPCPPTHGWLAGDRWENSTGSPVIVFVTGIGGEFSCKISHVNNFSSMIMRKNSQPT